jgi:SAM-dependent methyltransferase
LTKSCLCCIVPAQEITLSASELNRAAFERASVVAEYAAGAAELFPQERPIFERFRDHYLCKRVLDIGVGGGRTTSILAPRASRYVGIDYSQAMVDACKSRYPYADVRQGDARDLSDFAEQSFDFVMFSFNGIDNADHGERQVILRQIARVLIIGGVFTFSSHNLAFLAGRKGYLADLPRGVGLSSSLSLAHPFRCIPSLMRIGRRLTNFAVTSRRACHGNGYALVCDPGHDFRLLQYHVDIETQRKQLRDAKFGGELQVFDRKGLPVIDAAPDSPWLQYLIVK